MSEMDRKMSKTVKKSLYKRQCCVVGCKVILQKHFYTFPKDPILRDLWVSFTRQGSDYKIRSTSYICEDHFAPSGFRYKKSHLRIKLDAVPTIFYRFTSLGGLEKVVLTYDSSIQHYSEADQLQLIPEFGYARKVKDLVEKYKKRVREVASVCHFCLEDQSEVKLVEVSKLKDYSISIDEVYKLMSIKTNRNPLLSQLACEECFQQVIIFDGFRKRCRKAQKDSIESIYEIDLKIKKLQGNDTEPLEKAIKTLNSDKPGDEEYQPPEEVNDVNEMSPHKVETEVDFKDVKVKTEVVAEDFEDNFMDYSMPDYNDESDFNDSDDEFLIKSVKHATQPSTPEVSKTILEVIPKKEEKPLEDEPCSEAEEMQIEKKETSEVVKMQSTKGTRRIQVKIYECFKCHLKFASNKIFREHKCLVERVNCLDVNCNMTFKSIKCFNSHIVKIHKLPKLLRYYCCLCKFSMIATIDQSQEHRRKCESSFAKKIVNNEIICKECNKVCPNNQAYKIHMMFHQSTLTTVEPEVFDRKKKEAQKRGVFICESCGREFTSVMNLRGHIQRVHSDPSDNPKFTCDICGKIKKTIRILRNHINAVHRFEPVPCKVCGKVFKNKILILSHMVYHKESKRIHFCPLCPDKPAYFTAVALRRHQESRHSIGNGFSCEICCAVYRTKHGLRQHKVSIHPAGS